MFRIGIFILSFMRVGKKKQSFVHRDAIYWVTLAITKNQKKSRKLRDFLYSKSRNITYFFFSLFSILAFKPARISLLSPRVAAGAFVAEATASATALTAFSSSSRKIAV